MEQILHYVWKHKLFQKGMTTTDGLSVEILDVGLHNTDEGPDFFNSKIKIGDRIWSGNVEIHKNSDDWYKHKHQENPVYNSVILHVVEKATNEIRNQQGFIIPQCEIRYSKQIDENIDFLLKADVDIPCCNYIKDLSSFTKSYLINSLLLERLERKANDIALLLNKFNNSWTDVFYVLLARSMGFGLNSDAFERLALSLPLNFILKQADKIEQIEALLFGQAGLLSDLSTTDEYALHLQNEYAFLQKKYDLKPLDQTIFRKLRQRPSSSIYIRIAQLASLVCYIQGLYRKLISTDDIGQIRLLLHHKASSFWDTHYSFGNVSSYKSKYIGDASLDILIINVVVPLVFAYGKQINNEQYQERAIDFLEKLKPESNSILRQFSMYGLKAENAYESQAIIQLKREYCEKRKCLYCRIGYETLTKK